MTASPFDEEHDMTLTHDPGDDLRPLLATAISDRPAATDLLAGVRRARRARRVVVRTASLATAGALGAGALAVWSAGAPASAQAQLVAAVENTSGQGFHVHTVSKDSAGVKDSGGLLEGAFDLATHTGRLATSGGGQNLFVGDTVYTENVGAKALKLAAGKHWISSPRMTEAELAQMGTAIEVLKFGAQDPQLVLQQLRSATNVRETGPASGAGWTGRRYSFSVEDKADAKGGSLSVTGTVAIDSQDLVRVLDLTVLTKRSEGPAAPKGDESNVVIEFSDYGATVDVTAPPADQVVSLSEVLQYQPKSKAIASESPGNVSEEKSKAAASESPRN
jgi:hypothetical protein